VAQRLLHRPIYESARRCALGGNFRPHEYGIRRAGRRLFARGGRCRRKTVRSKESRMALYMILATETEGVTARSCIAAPPG
jgi:hypothetical protein